MLMFIRHFYLCVLCTLHFIFGCFLPKSPIISQFIRWPNFYMCCKKFGVKERSIKKARAKASEPAFCQLYESLTFTNIKN